MKLLFLFILIAISFQANSQNTLSFTQNLDSILQSYIQKNNIPVVGVGIVYKQKNVFAKTFQTEFNKGKNINSDRLVFNIASVTKPFVALAVMKLASEKKISLDSPIISYLPYFKLRSKDYPTITVKQLLNHTSGLPAVSSPDVYEYKNPQFGANALQEYVSYLNTLKLKFKPGKKYSYSNVGFNILGEIIAKVSGLSFEEYMQKTIFDPLGMKNTTYFYQQIPKQLLALPHINNPAEISKNFPYHRAYCPSGNLFTTAADLNKWMIFNLNRGIYNTEQIIPKNKFELLFTPTINTGEDGDIGLSWFIDQHNTGKIFTHDGKDLGYRALIVLFDAPKIGIVILSNHIDTDCNEILNFILKNIRF